MDENLPIAKIPKRIGIAADHGGFHLKDAISKILLETGYEIVDFGNKELKEGDDYPDYVIPLAQAVALEEVDRGIAVCGSGVGACIAANKVKGVRACLITDTFSAHQGVEDDNMNLICLGGRITGQSLAFEVVDSFLNAQFSSAERHRRRTSKVTELE
jgi:ribose 5-phosphate isomerase B